ncbi:heterokaryon incompatibility protein-domain-containing protein [Podospora conica]|nr:heterokaryon incompatibility protein-domain-containing protein [Schizothecium conicum]
MGHPKDGSSSRCNQGCSANEIYSPPTSRRARRRARRRILRAQEVDTDHHTARRAISTSLSSSQRTTGEEEEGHTPIYNLPRCSTPHRQPAPPGEPSIPFDPQDTTPSPSGPRPPAPEPLEKNISSAPAQYDGTEPQSGRPVVPPRKQTHHRQGDGQFRYRELQESCIRLLKLFPGKKTRIRCEMVHASLNNLPRYMAISYAWGEASDTRTIELNNAIVPITASLYGALNAVRYHKSRMVLVWADALCINQKDTAERSEQVALMTRIYAEADRVAVWLGPEEDDSSSAISFLQHVSNLANTDTGEFVSLVESEAAKPDSGHFGSVVNLFEREYWDRLWIVQEVINARSITVHCGASKISWPAVINSVNFFQEKIDRLDTYLATSNCISSRTSLLYSGILTTGSPETLESLKQTVFETGDSLLKVLVLSRHRLASDPKDKVFGLLGILPARIQREFPADYAMSVREVYTGIVDYLIKTTESLDVICEAFSDNRYNPHGLPSFVPDWSRTGPAGTQSIRSTNNYNAALGTKAECHFLDERLCFLEISTVYIDEVRSHGMPGPAGTKPGDHYAVTFLQWRAMLLKALAAQPDRSMYWAEVEFAQTLCLGVVPREWRHDPEEWLRVCYKVFARELQRCLPSIVLDESLRKFLDIETTISDETLTRLRASVYLASHMNGHSFCMTLEGYMGCGQGDMLYGDIVVVPLGCSVPIIIRPYGRKGHYRYVGDLYLHGFMDGKAVRELNEGKRELTKYVLC